jgi:hypothetical protein
MLYNREARSPGYFVSVSTMNTRYASIIDARTTFGATSTPAAKSTRRTVEW